MITIANKETEDTRTTVTLPSALRRKIKAAASLYGMTIPEYLDRIVEDVYQKPDCIRIREEIEKEIKEGKFNDILEVKNNE